jgi:hypothetical protein
MFGMRESAERGSEKIKNLIAFKIRVIQEIIANEGRNDFDIPH